MPLLLHDPVAHWLIVAAAVVVVVGEVVATFLGRPRDGKRQARRSLMDSLRLYLRGRGAAMRQDRGTRLIVTLAMYLGIFAALAIANVSGLRAYANNWWTLGLGVALVLAGTVLRAWAIVSLGRYFRRDVTIEPGQQIVRRGPYRVLRHPS
jgi:membrane protein YdbS with pleckstrin-like domain